MRVAALEDNVAFLEHWCEEQQDILDRTAGPIAYDYEREPEPRHILRVVDLRDVIDADRDEPDEPADGEVVDAIVALVDTDHDRRVGQIQERLNRLRRRLAVSLAPAAGPSPAPAPPPAPRPHGRPVSAKPAGRTAP
jgi:hypothetical protein